MVLQKKEALKLIMRKKGIITLKRKELINWIGSVPAIKLK